MKSIWNSTEQEKTTFATLENDIETDVIVIGGGITGISIAHALSGTDYETTVIEARKIAGGTTAHSTGNLYATTDKNLLKLKKKYDLDTLDTLITARAKAIDKIEKNVQHYHLECDFYRTPWFLYSMDDDAKEKIENEFSISKDLGLPVQKTSEGLPYKPEAAMKMSNQAQINGKLYVQQLAKKLDLNKIRIFEDTPAHDIQETDAGVQVTTTNGKKIKAKYLVHATHTPKGINTLQLYMAPYREFGVAFKAPKETVRPGIFWGYHGEQNFISSRFYTHQGDDYLMVVGQPYKVGQGDSEQSLVALRSFAHQHFGLKDSEFEWGGQHYRPADLLPFIGREKEGSHVFVATGYSTDGLVYGTLAGQIILDELEGRSSKVAELLRPYRNSLIKGAKKLITESANVAIQYLKSIPDLTDDEDIQNLAAGSGRVIQKGGRQLAAYKDEKGKVHCCSAVCSHMKCVVDWNKSEKSWDCPCHGSRFDWDGTVIEGPALHNLEPK